MLKTKRERELSEADFDWLGAMLARVAGGKVPNIEALDGFMTALVICPDRVPPDEYMPVLICGRTEDDDLDFESVEEAEQFHDVLTRYFDEISRVLRRGELRMPCMAESGEELPAGNDWANGFLAGSHLRHDLWSEIVNDEKRATALIPIWALAYEHDELAGAAGKTHSRSDRQRKAALHDVPGRRPRKRIEQFDSRLVVAQGRPKRSLPLRFRKEVQSVLRQTGLSLTHEAFGSPIPQPLNFPALRIVG